MERLLKCSNENLERKATCPHGSLRLGLILGGRDSLLLELKAPALFPPRETIWMPQLDVQGAHGAVENKFPQGSITGKVGLRLEEGGEEGPNDVPRGAVCISAP